MLPALFVALCVVFRVLPHPPNVAPVGATAVFAGRTMTLRGALCLVAVAMIAGDLALAHAHGYRAFGAVTPFVYAGFGAQALLGRLGRARKGGVLAAAAGGALAFFALSNFGVWLVSGMYAHTAGGLASCYAAALPFLGRTLLGDVVWSAALWLAYRPAAARLERRPGWVPVRAGEMGAV
ncbi:MAG TPA: DUF6580 family putative transport protein [Polyangiaceae bacterium]|nr:DUF6580 family putative transport protein [Polyangiaceae bacterium]